MRAGLKVTHLLGASGARHFAHFLGWAGSQTPLRSLLAGNLRRAGVDPERGTLDRYFRRFGSWLGWSAAVYNGGFVPSAVAGRITFDETLQHLDRACDKGCGVVLASPHAFCHELGAAAVNRRHPVVAVVRESNDRARERMKARWYQATGMETLHRSRDSSLLVDTVAYLRTLRAGKVLGITPDVIYPSDKGLPVSMFGRKVVLSPGFIFLAMRSGAPLVSTWCRWIEGKKRSEDRLVLRFDEPIEFPKKGDRDALVRAGLEEWCRTYEARFRAAPQDWMFWLDKRWTKVFCH
jgi:lauroyl/myristoyl acyltransferase